MNRVRRAGRERGDLAFFDFDGGGIDHTAVLIGGDRLVSASSPSVGVVVRQLDGYYRQHLVAFRRPDK